MGWFDKNDGEAVGTVVDSIGSAITGTVESINYALSGDLPPDVRIKLEEIKLEVQKVEANIMEGQYQLTKREGESKSFFKSGWRPMLAWIGVTGFSLVFVIFPIAEWILNIAIVFNKIYLTPSQVVALRPPEIDGWLLLNLLAALLGIGTLRSIEKAKGVTK